MNSFQRAHKQVLEAPTLPVVRSSRNGTEAKKLLKDKDNVPTFGADIYLQDSNRYRGRVKELFGKGTHTNQSKLKNIVGV